MIIQNANFIYSVFFFDKSTFCFIGHIKYHKYRYLSDRNPNSMVQIHTQCPQKNYIWCCIIGHHIIDLFIINGCLIYERYLKLLQQQVVSRHRQIFRNYQTWAIPSKPIRLQHDETPPHFGRQDANV